MVIVIDLLPSSDGWRTAGDIVLTLPQSVRCTYHSHTSSTAGDIILALGALAGDVILTLLTLGR